MENTIESTNVNTFAFVNIVTDNDKIGNRHFIREVNEYHSGTV